MHRIARRSLPMLLGAALALLASTSYAEPTAADKETARALLIDGRAKLAAKDYEGALRSFRGAHAIMGVPTTGLDLARGLEGVGRLIDARATALDVTRIPVKPGESPAFAEARAAAAEFASRLAARIPAVVITVKGPPGARVEVTLDGVALRAALIGLPRKVDPGVHVVAASAAGLTATARKVEVREGATVGVEMVLQAPVVNVPVLARTAQRPPPVAVREVAPTTKRHIPIWTWIAGGAGLAAIGGSVAFAVDWVGVKGTVAKDCPGNVCKPGSYDLDGMQSLRGRWNRDLGLFVGLGAVGVAGVGAAIGGIVRAPRDEGRVGGNMFVPWVAPGVAGGACHGVF